jgi:hypothetical protein
MSAAERVAGDGGQESAVPATVAEAVDSAHRATTADAADAADEGAAERAALAGELFAPGVGAQAGPPRTPARATAVQPGASSAGGHSHGPGERPRAERFTSRNPDEFGVPTGREEEWRFTPLARLRDLLEPFEADQALTVETSAPDQVEVREVAGDADPVGTVLAPADRVSALALERVRRAHVVTCPRAPRSPSRSRSRCAARASGRTGTWSSTSSRPPTRWSCSTTSARPGWPPTSSCGSATARR